MAVTNLVGTSVNLGGNGTSLALASSVNILRHNQMKRFNCLTLPQSVVISAVRNGKQFDEKKIVATSASSASGEKVYDLAYYLKGALAGGICCSITHGGMCPVDVAKTLMQLYPENYNKGLMGTISKVIAERGVGGLATGLGPTVIGYFVQGWFKFGGVEFFKVNFAKALGEQAAWDNRTAIYLGASAMAEFIADIFLCPLEATRIRLVECINYVS